MMMRFQRRQRTSFTRDQLDTLHEAFNRSNYPESKERNELARMTNLEPTRIQVWFQNQRAKVKKRKSLPPFSSTSTSSFEDQSTPSPPTGNHHHHEHQRRVVKQPPQASCHSLQQTLPVIYNDSNHDSLEAPQPNLRSRLVHIFSSGLANEAAEAVRQGRAQTILQYHESKCNQRQRQRMDLFYDSFSN